MIEKALAISIGIIIILIPIVWNKKHGTKNI